MTRRVPAFPPDVATALQRPDGRVSVRYTPPAALALAPSGDLPLMSTAYERVLAAITLDSKLNVRFVRTGDAAEGTRVALASVARLWEAGSRRWQITLVWDPTEIFIEVHDAAVPTHIDAAK
jgi:hypothetical protein